MPAGAHRSGAELLALGLVSGSLTANQVVLVHLLSFTQWHYLAYMLVAVALLGFGASGTVLSLCRFDGRSPHILFLSACALSMPLGVSLSQLPWIRVDLYLLFQQPAQVVRFVLTCFLLFLPFFFGALSIGLCLTQRAAQAGRTYAANLLGAGLGAIMALLLLDHVPQETLPGILGLFPATAALLYGGRRLVVTALCTCIVLSLTGVPLKPSPFKDIRKALDLPDAHIVHHRPSSHGSLHRIRSDAIRAAPGLSLNYMGPLPLHDLLTVNGDSVGSLPRDPHGDARDLLSHTPAWVFRQLRTPQHILLLQTDIASLQQALHGDANEIVLLEAHPLVREEVAGTLGADSSVSGRVQLLQQPAARHHLLAATEAYDLIRFPSVGHVHGSVGLQALQPEFLLTLESFCEAWDRLTAEGMISIDCWLDHPPRVSLKLIATLEQTLEERGITAAERHLLAIRSWNTLSIALLREPLRPDEAEAIRAFCRDRSFDPLLLPGIDEAERQVFHIMADASFFNAVDRLRGPTRAAFLDDYPFTLEPARDHSPYFSRFLKLRSLSTILQAAGWRQLPFFELGTFILLCSLGVLLVLSTTLILLPLRTLGPGGAPRAGTLLYFGGLGCGYMLVEMVLMQRLTLLLGHPLTATATVIAALLIFSSLGSLCSERLQPKRHSLCLLFVAILFLLLATCLLFHLPLRSLSPGSFVGRIGLSVLSIAPLAVAMGMPFPLGLRMLRDHRSRFLPWAWGINGCVSVVTPACAILLAVHLGFDAVFLSAGVAYGLAFLCVPMLAGKGTRRA